MIDSLRDDLKHPAVDPTLLAATVALVGRIYGCHEAGEPYDTSMTELSQLTGQNVTKSDVCGAFGSVTHKTFAYRLLRDRTTFPTDLTHEDLLTLTQLVIEAQGEEWQHEYWFACLERATGCDALSDLIYYPDDYFDEDPPDHELTANEILTEALNAGARPRRVLITPPPQGTA